MTEESAVEVADVAGTQSTPAFIQSSIEDIFEGSAEGDKPVVSTPAAETEGAEEVGSTPEPKSAEAKEEAKSVPLNALLDERDKRKKLEQQLEALQPKVEVKTPSVFEDESAFTKHQEAKFEERLFVTKLEQSQFLANREYGKELTDWYVNDFKRIIGSREDGTFRQDLADRMRTSASPFHEMATISEEDQAAREFKDLPSLKAKLRQEIEAEWKKEQESQQTKAEAARLSIPTSLVGMSSSGKLTGGSWSGPAPLANLLGDN